MAKYFLLVFSCFIFYFKSLAGKPVTERKTFSLRADTLGLFEVSPVPDKSRIHLINYSIAAIYPVSMLWLYTQWYKDYPQSSFHFFNDNGEWNQMDKFAHMWDAYSV